MSYCLEPAAVTWDTAATPRSLAHDDIYWSRDAGLAEKRHVFIDGNDLPQRFARVTDGHFTIAEVGFGFGLNFLLTVDAWRAHRRGGVLHYIAFERAPVTTADLARCHARLFPDDAAAKALLDAWPMPSPGWHTRWIGDDVCLVLGLGDASQLLDDFDGRADAWFLDGFSPSRNPDAWQTDLIDALPSHSTPGASLATYSVAGAVRAALIGAGCRLEKRRGHGRKAEMLTGCFAGDWMPQARHIQRVGIVGAGLAGLSCARALVRRGVRVSLFETGDAILAGASGAPGLAVYPKLSLKPEWPALASLAAFGFARRHDPGFRETGRCHLVDSDAEVARCQTIARQLPADFARWLDAAGVSEKIGATSRMPGLWLAHAGHTNPRETFADLEPMVTCKTQVRAITGTQIVTDHDTLDFDAVVIASGHRFDELCAGLPLEPVRGQSVTGTLSSQLRAVVGGPVSVVPLSGNGDRVVMGGTYDKRDVSLDARPIETEQLVQKLSESLDTGFSAGPAWTGIRATTRDRQPIAGPLPDWRALDRWCSEEGLGDFTGWVPGCYVCTGLGSHGATWAPLLGEHVARLILEEPGCLGAAWAGRIGPARFRLRDAGRRRDVGFSRVR